MLLVIIGKCHRYKNKYRQNIHYDYTNRRKCEKCYVELLVEECLHIFLECIYMFSFFLHLLKLVHCLDIVNVEKHEYKNDEQRNHRIEKDLERIVVIISGCLHGEWIKYLLKLYSSKSSKFGKVWCRIAYAHQHKRSLNDEHDQTIDDLLSCEVTCTHDNR